MYGSSWWLPYTPSFGSRTRSSVSSQLGCRSPRQTIASTRCWAASTSTSAWNGRSASARRRKTHVRMTAVDPYAVLGLAPGAPERDVTAAYRELAKRWHPDRGAGAEREQRMAEINAAYDLLRSAADTERRRPRPAPSGRRRPGGWLPDAVRRALGA